MCSDCREENSVCKSEQNRTQHCRLLPPLCETKTNLNIARGTTEQSPAYLVITVYIYLEKEAPLERLMCLILLQSPTKQT